MNTVFAHTPGLDTSVLRICWTRYSPYSGGAAGCSHIASGVWIQDTAGSAPLATSATKSAGYTGRSPFSGKSSCDGDGSTNCLKYGSGDSSTSEVGSL